MAFDIIRQVLGNMANQRMAARTPEAQSKLLGLQLQNKLMAKQIEDEFPMKLDILQQQLRNLTEEPERLAAQMQLKQKLSEIASERQFTSDLLRSQTEIEVANIRNKPMSKEVFEQKLTLANAGHQPMRPIQYTMRKDQFGKETKDPQLWRLDPNTGNETWVGAAGTTKNATAEQLGIARAKIFGNPEFEKAIRDSPIKSLFEGSLEQEDINAGFNQILAGTLNIDKYPALKAAVEEYKSLAYGNEQPSQSIQPVKPTKGKLY